MNLSKMTMEKPNITTTDGGNRIWGDSIKIPSQHKIILIKAKVSLDYIMIQ